MRTIILIFLSYDVCYCYIHKVGQRRNIISDRCYESVVNKCKKSNRFNFFGGSPLFTDLVSDVETVNYFSIGSSSSDAC